MSCLWNKQDCQNENSKCELCVSDSYHYKAPKKKNSGLKKRAMKADNRTGSTFEFNNYNRDNNNLVKDISTRLTPNSGAGYVKGDSEISGIITIMKEMKTKVKEQAPGKETFTIHKNWLTKLNREAKAANKEFWYLNFNFNENQQDVYTIIEADQMDSMVKTMVEDRKKVTEMLQLKEIAEAMRRKSQADLIAAEAEIDVLKAKLKLYEAKNNKNDDENTVRERSS